MATDHRIAIIDGHPDPDAARLIHALADAYGKGAEAAGHVVRTIAVAELDFPILRTAQAFQQGEVPPDIAEAQQAIAWADHLVILYPLWLGTLPALTKAFFEQVMRPGFALEEASKDWPKPKLTGRTARIVVTMGMPGLIYRWFYCAHSLRSLERNILKLCGIRPVGDTVIGLVDQADGSRRAAWLARLEALGRRAR